MRAAIKSLWTNWIGGLNIGLRTAIGKYAQMLKGAQVSDQPLSENGHIWQIRPFE